MKKLLFGVFLFCLAGMVQAAYSIKFNEFTVTATTNSCNDVKSAWNTWAMTNWIGKSLTACSSDPAVTGTSVTWSTGSVFVLTVTPICVAGTHLDTSTQTCVDDITIPVASCMPSIRTISPCPSGYAPTNAIPAGSGAPTPFTSAFDGLPIQDMIYAVGIAICALLGVSVGVKLI